MARRFRFDTSVAGPFVGRCISNLAMLRFHTPIIKPDLWYKLWGAKGTVVIVAADRVHRVTKGRLVIETARKLVYQPCSIRIPTWITALMRERRAVWI